VRYRTSTPYYEEVGIILTGSRSEPVLLMGVGPGLCGTSQNAVWAKFAEPSFQALR
jgi:hypothetical protein